MRFAFLLAAFLISVPSVAQQATPSPTPGPSSPTQTSSNPYVWIFTPNIAYLNEPFTVQIQLVNGPEQLTLVKVEQTHDLYLSEHEFKLRPGERKYITARIKSSRTGLAWIHADAGPSYEDRYEIVNLGFIGHLKPSTLNPVAYNTEASLDFTIIDGDGKSVPFDSELNLTLDSSDATLKSKDNLLTDGSDKKISVKLQPGSRSTPFFQVVSKNVRGGDIHLSASLSVPERGIVLAQQDVVLPAQPAWWLPFLLALGGGLLHGFYKIVKLPVGVEKAATLKDTWSILATSAIAGIVGYLFADFDLLGLKLDPNLLRTYPVMGFLFAYFGFDIVLGERFSKTANRKNPNEPDDSNADKAMAQGVGTPQ
jgi:hypothetical protein